MLTRCCYNRTSSTDPSIKIMPKRCNTTRYCQMRRRRSTFSIRPGWSTPCIITWTWRATRSNSASVLALSKISSATWFSAKMRCWMATVTEWRELSDGQHDHQTFQAEPNAIFDDDNIFNNLLRYELVMDFVHYKLVQQPKFSFPVTTQRLPSWPARRIWLLVNPLELWFLTLFRTFRIWWTICSFGNVNRFLLKNAPWAAVFWSQRANVLSRSAS